MIPLSENWKRMEKKWHHLHEKDTTAKSVEVLKF
jgi:hypothetical protein